MIYAAPGLLDSRLVYMYNVRGEVASKREYLGNNSLAHDWSYEYKYDSHGNWVEQIASDLVPAESRMPSRKIKELIYRSIEYLDGK